MRVNFLMYLESNVGIFVHAKYFWFVHNGEGLYVVPVFL